MPRNGSGQYSAPTNSWNPAINGVPATAADWQAVLNDVVSAMTQSVSRDGQTAMTGNLPMAGNKVTGLGNATATGDALTFAQLFSQGQQQDVPAAATTDIGAQLSTIINVTGAATITSFGTNYNGPRFLRFAGVCTLTNSATLVLPGGANITTAAGDSCIAVPLGNPATGWRVAGTGDVSMTGDQTIGGVKTFSGRVNGKTSGTDATPAFFASTTGGAFAAMWTRRGAPFFTTSETTGSSYAPALAHQYTHNGGWAGVYSVGVLNHSAASPGSLVIHHIDSGGSNDRVWQFRGDTGEFAAPGNITANGQFIGNGSVPPGAVMHFAMNSVPTGWLRANGAAVSRTTFAALFNAIGTTYGAGDGSTTFRLPDLRGEFLRGWDDGRGVDSGRVFGSAQAGEIQSHTHDIGTRIDFLSGGGSGVLSSFSPTGTAAGAAQARGGTETRPRNIALLACIKF